MHSKLVIYSLPLLFVIGLTGCGETGLATGSNNTSSQTATVYISSVPSSAQIYINNASQGYTPRVFNKITPGMYSLKLTKSRCFNDTSCTLSIEEMYFVQSVSTFPFFLALLKDLKALFLFSFSISGLICFLNLFICLIIPFRWGLVRFNPGY